MNRGTPRGTSDGLGAAGVIRCCINSAYLEKTIQAGINEANKKQTHLRLPWPGHSDRVPKAFTESSLIRNNLNFVKILHDLIFSMLPVKSI